MKKYKLISLKERTTVGKITANNTQLSVDTVSNKKELQQSIKHITESINKQGNFKVKITQNEDNLNLQDTSDEFLLALKQSLFSDLEIIPEEIN